MTVSLRKSIMNNTVQRTMSSSKCRRWVVTCCGRLIQIRLVATGKAWSP